MLELATEGLGYGVDVRLISVAIGMSSPPPLLVKKYFEGVTVESFF